MIQRGSGFRGRLLARIAALVQRRANYRPERHYMRGRGPKSAPGTRRDAGPSKEG